MWYWDLEIVELASLGYPFLPLQLQPLVGSFYYWNMLTYSRTNRSITFIEPSSGIGVVIVQYHRHDAG